MNLFLKLFTAYTIGIIFFMAVLPRIITNNLETKNNPFSYSHVLINN